MAEICHWKGLDICNVCQLKGSVQLTKVIKNSSNRWVPAWDCGAGYFFLYSKTSSSPVRTARLLGDF
jgi:hypothetical protein